MGLFEKLKGVNKKWFYLLAVIVILGIGAAIAGEVVEERYQQKMGNYNPSVSRDAFLDLLYLETNESLKITPEQAKELLPLVERVAKVSDSSQFNLVQNIYSLLNPQQYQALLNKDNNVDKLGKDKDSKKRRHEENYDRDQRYGEDDWVSLYFKRDGKELYNAKEAALKNVVVNMLKDKISGNSNKVQTNNSQNSTNGIVYSSN